MQYWMQWAALMEFRLFMIDRNGKRRMESNRSDNSCFLSMFNKWRVHPTECTFLLPVSSVGSLNSLYRIPNGMFCSSHSYLLFMSWITPMLLLLCISRGVFLHLLSPNDLDCNPFSCPTVHMIFYTPKCPLYFCIPVPIWWLCHSYLQFFLHGRSPTFRNTCGVHQLKTCCLTRLLLLVLESILFLDIMEIEWGIQQHPQGQGHR